MASKRIGRCESSNFGAAVARRNRREEFTESPSAPVRRRCAVRRREFLAGLACAGISCAQRSSAPIERDELIDIGGRRLHARIWGSGTPVVVIDVGIGEAIEPWTPVISRLAAHTRVCAYERAGYGRSDGGPLPRTAHRVTSDLRLLLSKLSLPPPYVLVGHSLGALHVMLLAAESPELTGAMLLLDPPPHGFISGERFPALLKMAVQQTVEFQRMAKVWRHSSASRTCSEPWATAPNRSGVRSPQSRIWTRC